MLWKDFDGKEDCSGCPLLDAEICPDGVCCYGGTPVEPPCCSFDDNTDLDEWVRNYFEQQRIWEEREDARIREKKKKKEQAKKAADTRRAIRLYCWDEIQELRRAQKALDSQKTVERLASSFAEAVNVTNAMFQYAERVAVKPEISKEVRRLEAEVAAAKEKYDAKRKKFYLQRRNKVE